LDELVGLRKIACRAAEHVMLAPDHHRSDRSRPGIYRQPVGRDSGP
jgi:hypothetical protein